MGESTEVSKVGLIFVRVLIKFVAATIIMLGLGVTSFPSLGFVDVFWGLLILDIAAFATGLTGPN